MRAAASTPIVGTGPEGPWLARHHCQPDGQGDRGQRDRATGDRCRPPSEPDGRGDPVVQSARRVPRPDDLERRRPLRPARLPADGVGRDERGEVRRQAPQAPARHDRGTATGPSERRASATVAPPYEEQASRREDTTVTPLNASTDTAGRRCRRRQGRRAGRSRRRPRRPAPAPANRPRRGADPDRGDRRPQAGARRRTRRRSARRRSCRRARPGPADDRPSGRRPPGRS